LKTKPERRKKIMSTDPTTEPVTARIVFTGVMLMCINDDKRCEVGMIQCPDHVPKITIREFKLGAQTNEGELAWPAGHDLIFNVNNAEAEGVSASPPRGDDTDFDKVIDLEGQDLHQTGVTVYTDLLKGRRLGVTAGKLYTHKLTDVEFDLLTWTDANDPGKVAKSLGRIAEEIGLNIVCRNGRGSGIDILDSVTRQTVKSLPNLPDTSYEIEVNNDCRRATDAPGPQPPRPQAQRETEQASFAATAPTPAPTPAPTVGTDFRFYYGAISSHDDRKFDLNIRTNPSAPPVPSPGVCNLAFLSQTSTLGLSWLQF
jgi:hypothetical protein